jgi:hypothetical protein
MRAVQSARAGIALGALIGGGQFCWALLVALGWAQPLVEPIYVVGPLDFKIAAIVIAVTTIAGFILGCAISVCQRRHRTMTQDTQRRDADTTAPT